MYMDELDRLLLNPSRPEGDSLAAIAWAGVKIFSVGAAVIVGVPLLLYLAILILY